SKVDATGATFTDDTKATNVTSTTIRVNGVKGDNDTVTGGVVIGNQSVIPSDDGKKTDGTPTTGNFITGLDNKDWNVTSPTFVSGRAATEDQLVAVSKQFGGIRQFVGDTKTKEGKDLALKVKLGETLAIKGGATNLTDKNIGVEVTEAVTNKDGTIKTPATMTVKLAKNVEMQDGTTHYTGTHTPQYYDDKKKKYKPILDDHKKPVEMKTDVLHSGTDTTYTMYRPGVDPTKEPKATPFATTNVSPLGVTISSTTLDGKEHRPDVSLTFNGLNNGGNRITNVAPGVKGTDAVNLDQLKDATNNVMNEATGDIYKAGAKAAALAALKPLQYDPLEPTQIMAGIGNYKKETAVALGIAHFTREDTMFHAGITLGENENMFNAGFSHKFGWSADKRAVPDRYKAGPISSVYVLQDEVIALKEENATTKAAYKKVLEDNAHIQAENQEMKASYSKMAQDNEEMKAQIKKLMQAMGIK
ncbi:YadA-like family protein, partial [Veillonella montpellierensis]|uniref:YadA-like family protein n=1 Tax=Veillonella montpellierensis TaxID=187328 RepID=UPI00056E38C2